MKSLIVTFFVCFFITLSVALFLMNRSPLQSVIYSIVASFVVMLSLKYLQKKNSKK